MAQMLQGNIPFSATTASIEFNGKVVGQLQNLRWDERQNLKRVNEIGSSTPVAIMKGVSEYNISASKAFIDSDLIATLLRGMEVSEFKDAGGQTVTTKGRVSETGLLDESAAVRNALLSGGATQILRGAKLINFFFDIVISSYSATQANTSATGVIEAANLAMNEMIIFKECSIESRSARIDVGNLVVMQDISILSIGLQYGDSSVITGGI